MNTANERTAQFWRDRATEARAQGQKMPDPIARDAMMKVAQMYEDLSKEHATPGPETKADRRH
jgi:hypothetical protein